MRQERTPFQKNWRTSLMHAPLQRKRADRDYTGVAKLPKAHLLILWMMIPPIPHNLQRKLEQ
jgi:hypothetical protein